MADARRFIGGNHLKAEDLGNRVVRVMIAKVEVEDVRDGDDEGAPAKRKLVASFNGRDKTLVLNKTNIETLAFITGSYDTDMWAGREVEIYNDPSVMFGAKRVGGVRLRAPGGLGAANMQAGGAWSSQAASPGHPPIVPPPAPVTDDDIPF